MSWNAQRGEDTPALGAAVGFRDRREGRVYFAWPNRVIDAQPGRLFLAQRPGAVGQVVRGYPSDVDRMLKEMAKPAPELVELTWTRTVTLGICEAGSGWYTRLFWDGDSGAFLFYYVDFVRPIIMNGSFVDTSDLVLDIVVREDRSWSFKDEDEYTLLRQHGWVTEKDHRSVSANRGRVVALIEAGEFPFDGSLVHWVWPASLSVPALPPGWDA